MKTALYRIGIIALIAAGLADAIYLTRTALLGASLTCTIAGLEGCNIVAQSAYSKVFGLPLALYGIVFYGVLLVAYLYSTSRTSKGMDRLVFFIALAGALFSSYFLYLQVFVIKALCIYCLGSAAVSYLLAIMTWVKARAVTAFSEIVS